MTPPPLPDDFITFTPSNPGFSPLEVRRYIRMTPETYDVHILCDGKWEYDDNVEPASAEKAFRECWEAYQRVIT